MADLLVTKFAIQNVDALSNLSAIIPQATDNALEQILRTLKVKIQGRTPVGIRYKSFGKTKKGKSKTRMGKGSAGKRYKGSWVVSGELKRSWVFAHEDSAISASTDVPYAGMLEEGGYPGIGKLRWGLMPGGYGQVAPRTVSAEGGIFSSRAVGG